MTRTLRRFLAPATLAALMHLAWVLLLKANLVRLRGGVSAGSAPGLLLPDLAFELALLAVWLWVGGRRAVLRVPGAVLLFGTALLAGLSFGVRAKTGSELGWGQLWFTITQIGEQLPVLRSEFHPADVLLFAVPFVVLLLGICGGRRPVPRPLAGTAGLAALAAVCAGLAPGAGSAAPEPLRESLLGSFLRVGSARHDGAVPLDLLPPPERMFDEWARRPPDAPRPNLIVVMMESVRATATSMYAPHLPTTPFLAEKAKAGLLVERAYCMIPHTSKSIVSVFTGHPPRLRLVQRKVWTLAGGGLPRLVRELGYRTAFFEPSTERFEERRLLIEGLGFEEYYCEEDIGGDAERTHYFGRCDECLVDPVVTWAGKEPGRPFLLAMVNLSTHHDYVAPSTWKPTEFDVANPPPKAARFQLYLNTVRYLDGVLREMFGQLAAAGLMENTVVVCLGDHGQAFGEHGKDAHLDVIYDEALRIPIVLWGPERYLGTPRRIAGLRQNLDVYATLADVLGVPGQRRRESPARGVSLLAPPDPRRRLFMSSWYQGGDMAMVERWRKFLYFAVRDRLEHYDLRADPLERADLGGTLPDKERSRVIDAMLGFRAGVNMWYLRAEAAEIDAMRVERLPELQRPAGVALGGWGRVAGFEHPAQRYQTAYFDVRIGFDVLREPPDVALGLVAQRNGDQAAVETLRNLNRLPVRAWRAGERVLLRAKARITEPGTWTLRLMVGERAVQLGTIEIRSR